MLAEYLNSDTIQLNVHASNWEDAVRAAGQILVDRGKCTPHYIDAMIGAVRTIGPYMVLAPGLALAHARPEDGVLEIGLSLVTLKKPVKFGSEANDPVSLVIAFGGVDKTSHVKLLTALAGLLEDEKRRDAITTARNVKDVIATIHQFEG